MEGVLELFDPGKRGKVPVEDMIGGLEPVGELGDKHSSQKQWRGDLRAKKDNTGGKAQGGVYEGDGDDSPFRAMAVVASIKVPVREKIEERV